MRSIFYFVSALILLLATSHAQQPLPSWNTGETRESILDFVQSVTDPTSDDFVPESERIAVFDNDGTLWAEQPIYFQFLFAIDRIKALAPEHPEWANEEPYASVLRGDLSSVAKAEHEEIFKIIAATHSGMTAEEFDDIASQWIQNATHPGTNKPLTQMIYQPMVELLTYLRENGFQTWIVSGGGIDFMRSWTEEIYGIPPQQVIGSSFRLEYEVIDGKPSLIRTGEIDFIDDKEGKPIGIHRHIGKRPIFAAGNSDGDFQMLDYVSSGAGPRMAVLVHHTDPEREWAYDRDSSIGRLDRGLDEANQRGWVMIDMAKDWNTVFPSGN